jgi:hypothetical protein
LDFTLWTLEDIILAWGPILSPLILAVVIGFLWHHADKRYPKKEEGNPYIKEDVLNGMGVKVNKHEARLEGIQERLTDISHAIDRMQDVQAHNSRHIEENLIQPLQMLVKDFSNDLRKAREELVELRTTMRYMKGSKGRDE